MMIKMNDVKYELFDAFVGEEWFYDVRINESLFANAYEVELIVNEYFSISDLNDVKDELRFHGLEIYDDNYFITKRKVKITKRNVKDTYSVKFLMKVIE